MTFFVDGYETAAGVIALTLHLLAGHPKCQNRLREEILPSVDEEGNISYEKLLKLPYLDKCVNESLRIFSPLLTGSKTCTETCEIENKDGTKVRLEIGDSVSIPLYCIHHDEDYFPDPEKFIPERFDPENGGVKKFRDEATFFPFSDGPRQCLGTKFGNLVTKIGVMEVIQNFKLTFNNRSRKDFELDEKCPLSKLKGGVGLDLECLRKKLN